MAGHSKFKNIMHRKGAQDAKRAKKFTKLIREITTAARLGKPDPYFNPRLRAAISTAKVENLPKDKIDNAIKKGATPQDGENFEEIKYECYAFDGTALIIDALTDNRNRTASTVKSIMTKAGATPAEPGSALFMFDNMGYIFYNRNDITEDQMLELALEAGADECESDKNYHIIYTSLENFNDARDYLENKIGTPDEAKLTWKPKEVIHINNKETAEKLLKLVNNLEDNDDVQQVSVNYEIADDIMEKLNN